jgi:thiamine biosynthesis lipoprotein
LIDFLHPSRLSDFEIWANIDLDIQYTSLHQGMMNLSRRNFLLLGAGTTIGRGQELGVLKEVSRSGNALGSKVKITALHADLDLAQKAIDAAFQEVEKAGEIMSLYHADSQVSRLNRDGELASPHPWLVEALRLATETSKMSDGDFDITVQPLWGLYYKAKKEGRLPNPEEIRVAKEKVGWQKVEVGADRIQLHGKGTAITLNAIAQGFAADKAATALVHHGVEHALVDTGEFAAIGKSGKGRPWKVGIQHPREPDAFVAVASLEGCCLSTSGDYATKFSDDHTFHHIFDPSTGKSPPGLSSVSVCAPSATLADALSTTLSVSGVSRGLVILRDMPRTEALFVLKNGKIFATKNFPWTKARFKERGFQQLKNKSEWSAIGSSC